MVLFDTSCEFKMQIFSYIDLNFNQQCTLNRLRLTIAILQFHLLVSQRHDINDQEHKSSIHICTVHLFPERKNRKKIIVLV